MGRAGSFLVTVLVAVVFALVPTSAPAMSLPATLAADHAVGTLHGAGATVRTAFPLGYLGVSWRSGRAPLVRFRSADGWRAWSRAAPPAAETHAPPPPRRNRARDLLLPRGHAGLWGHRLQLPGRRAGPRVQGPVVRPGQRPGAVRRFRDRQNAQGYGVTAAHTG